MNPIKSRLNRDNLCNLMFWFGMSFGFLLVDIAGDTKIFGNILLGGIIFWFALILVPYFVYKFNKIEFTEEFMFVSNNSDTLNNKFPLSLGKVLIVALVTTVASVSLLKKIFPNLNSFLLISPTFSIFFGVIVAYFIYKNCPIAILFNKNAWQKEITGIKLSNRTLPNHIMSHNSIFSDNKSLASKNICTDSSYKGMSCNIYNSNHNK